MATLTELAVARGYGDITEREHRANFKNAVAALGVQRADFKTVALVESWADKAAFASSEADKYREKATALATRGKDAGRVLKVVERNERIRDEHLEKITVASLDRPDLFLVDVDGAA